MLTIKTKIHWLFAIALLSLALGACSKDRISYVEMVKRETKEINHFLQEQGITVVDKMPEGKVTNEHTFVQILEGVYLRVVKPGTTQPISGKTVVHARFQLKVISPRDSTTYDNLSAYSGGTPPLSFVYNDAKEIITPDPKASKDEQSIFQLSCSAMQEAMKYVGDNSEVQLITTFREGPSFANRNGLPVFFERLTFRFKK